MKVKSMSICAETDPKQKSETKIQNKDLAQVFQCDTVATKCDN